LVRTLGELETEIMRRLWRRASPTTVRELVDELQEDRQIAYTTVMTVLDNLHKKGWLRRELDGRAYRYEPVSSGEQYSAELMRGALDTSPDHVAAFAHFLRQLGPEEVKALEDAYRGETGRRLTPKSRKRSDRDSGQVSDR
jgi:predicted transcriptional regulator